MGTPPKNIVLVGSSGSGKSTIGNILLDGKVCWKKSNDHWIPMNKPSSWFFGLFNYSGNKMAVTNNTNIGTRKCNKLESFDKKWSVIDTPGVLSADINVTDYAVRKELEEFLRRCHSVQINYVALILKEEHVEKLTHIEAIYSMVRKIFGKSTLQNVVIFVTHTKGQNNDKILAICQQQFKYLINNIVHIPPVHFVSYSIPKDDQNDEKVIEKADNKTREQIEAFLNNHNFEAHALDISVKSIMDRIYEKLNLTVNIS